MESATVTQALATLEAAAEDGKISAGAVDNIRSWLTEPRYAEFAEPIVEHLENGQFAELDDAFWTVIPFGTGGRRGRMYPFGSNTINDRTIGESAQGLADYVKEQRPTGDVLSCAIGYDTRHQSRHFAELCAEVMVAAGFQVYFLDDYRATPELSFLVRHRGCSCGIMVTASHNPPSDNAVKVYWSTGGQVLPPHDREIIHRVMHTETIERVPFEEALAAGKITICTSEVDQAFQAAVVQQSTPGPRDLHVVYSPLHGVGASAVCPVLGQAGFQQLTVYPRQAEPDGDFPNVPGHVSNPENPDVFAEIIEYARGEGGELILATDPDCDRMGAAAPRTTDLQGPWGTLNGNQLGALLADYVLEQKQDAGQLDERSYIVKTLVTTELIRRIADQYGVRTIGDLLVGFKWIAGAIDEAGPEHFVLGTEESHGYLVGDYIRDKDGAVACLLLAELAARLKAEGRTLHDKLHSLYWQFGYHREDLLTVRMEGSQGMAKMEKLMRGLREQPPSSLSGVPVTIVRDYESGVRIAGGQREPMENAPRGDLVILDLEPAGNYVAVRPSGTEPKVKCYLFGYQPAELMASLEEAETTVGVRLDGWRGALKELADNA